MTAALIIFGVLALVVGGLFLWLNLNSPVQTPNPAFAFPIGLGAILFALGGIVL